jgi:exodeoxyribonuclease VII large subunit
MSWDLFTSAEEARREAARAVDNNEALAHAVAARWADRDPARVVGAPAEWSVSALNRAARELIEGVFPALWVVGEVANFTRARSGHCYFTLRDADSQIRCVMWRDEARRLPTAPAEGMQVRVLGRLSLYESRGEFQVVASELEGRGDGLWKLALERLRARLDAEGLIAPQRKRVLPRCPAAVGVVTSPSGAVLHDIVTVVRRRAPWTRVVLAGCRVQGDGAAEEIAAAIRLFGAARCAEVLIVGRGGGSVEDLWAFNEEVVARAIAESPIPVISAVGHETDVTIADLVADHRAPTPSAAAEAAVPDGAALRRELGRAAERLAASTLAHTRAGRERVEDAGAALRRSAERLVQHRRERLGSLGRHLNALSPLSAFNRGFALPLDGEGRVLRRAGEFGAGREFRLLVQDGVVACRVAEGEGEAA